MSVPIPYIPQAVFSTEKERRPAFPAFLSLLKGMSKGMAF